ncbi:MAG: HNH endonuclease signature motif containing protein [Pantoea sp.]|nr:HNH endonuclease signature motif containing protein [Pantoea sp.]
MFQQGEMLLFSEIAMRWRAQCPDEPGLTTGGMLNPARGNAQTPVRALFAHDRINGDLDEFIFIAGDNDYKHYFERLKRAQQDQSPLWVFRKPLAGDSWIAEGHMQVARLLSPHSRALKMQLAAKGYRLKQDGRSGDARWQLFNGGVPVLESPRGVEFVLQLYPGTMPVDNAEETGRRVRREVWVRTQQNMFSSRVRHRYGACVITGLPLSEQVASCWIDAAHIDAAKTADGCHLRDNSTDNGLCLRKDLHALFDNRLLFIELPEGRLRFDREKLGEKVFDDYASLEGQICALWDLVPPATRQRLCASD